MSTLQRGYHNWNNAFDRLQLRKLECEENECRRETNLLDNFEAIRIVAMEDIRAHKREYRHDVVKNGTGSQSGQRGSQ